MEDPLFEKNFVAATYDDTNSKLFNLSFSDDNSKEILRENQQYSIEYDQMMKQEGNQNDAVHLYYRSWIQTLNLIGGCVLLGILIYKHK